MKKAYSCRYEEIPKFDKDHYWELHKFYESEGLKIKDNTPVEPTDWAIENGVVDRFDNRSYFKVRNVQHRNNTRGIAVIREGTKQSRVYWPGFWKSKIDR